MPPMVMDKISGLKHARVSAVATVAYLQTDRMQTHCRNSWLAASVECVMNAGLCECWWVSLGFGAMRKELDSARKQFGKASIFSGRTPVFSVRGLRRWTLFV